jgi:hypothetical protein
LTAPVLAGVFGVEIGAEVSMFYQPLNRLFDNGTQVAI